MSKIILTELELINLIERIIKEKTDYSKEKSKGLHGWFERQGGQRKIEWMGRL